MIGIRYYGPRRIQCISEDVIVEIVLLSMALLEQQGDQVVDGYHLGRPEEHRLDWACVEYQVSLMFKRQEVLVDQPQKMAPEPVVGRNMASCPLDTEIFWEFNIP